MKKAILVSIISALLIGSLVLWAVLSHETFKLEDLGMLVVLFIIAASMFVYGIRRARSARQGEPYEDEFSKNVMRRGAASSYYISLYWWLALSIYSENLKYETQTIIGIGIAGMAVIFFIAWIYHKINGVKNA